MQMQSGDVRLALWRIRQQRIRERDQRRALLGIALGLIMALSAVVWFGVRR